MRQRKQLEAVQLSGRVTGLRRTYFITRNAIEPPVIDDEATLEIKTVIEEAGGRYNQHVGEELEISLLSAARYDEPSSSTFHGAITIRESQRRASAYLPPLPFWALSGSIDSGDVLRLQFTPTNSGQGFLIGLYVESARSRDIMHASKKD